MTINLVVKVVTDVCSLYNTISEKSNATMRAVFIVFVNNNDMPWVKNVSKKGAVFLQSINILN